MNIRLKDLIAPPFYSVHNSIKNNEYVHYWLKGGRGSTKSSFISIEIILDMIRDPNCNVIAIRKVKDSTRESVYEQLVWAIHKLGVSNYFKCRTTPETIEYIPTGQRIYFRGMDSPEKLKSIKVAKGYIKILWYEEITELDGMEDIRKVNQSVLRGGDNFKVFYSYNPPANKSNWVNLEANVEMENRLVHSSDYRGVPKEWLGEVFLKEAELLEQTNPRAYRNEYLGEETGIGGEIFKNVTIRTITNNEINNIFDRIYRGCDWGFTNDPFAYNVMHYDSKYRKLYIFYEIYKTELTNKKAFELMKKENKKNKLIMSDSAEPKSIAEANDFGLKMKGAKKGPDSVDYTTKWLQDLEEIIIDDKRCPNTAREFNNYEYEPDGNGGFKDRFPDKDNHTIDAVRYALNDEMLRKKIRAGTRI